MARPEPRSASSLAALAALLDWAEIERTLVASRLRRRANSAGRRWPCSVACCSPPGTTCPISGWPRRWAGHRRRKPTHGYKAHVATDEGAGLVRGVEVTTANLHDAAELAAVLPPELGEVYGDSAFTGGPAERLIIARGGRPRTVWTGIHLGPRPGGAGPPGGAQRCRPPGPLPDREGVRDVEAVLWPAPEALARPGQGGPAGPSRRHGLQPPAHRHPAARRGGLMRDESARTTRRAPIGATLAHHGTRRAQKPAPPSHAPLLAYPRTGLVRSRR